MAKRIAGTAYIKADGKQFEVMGSLECPLTNTTKSPVMGLAGVVGYKEIAKEPYIKFDAGFVADFPINDLQNMTNGVITAELANGKVYTLTGAFLSGDENTADAEEGKAGLYFSGTHGIWS